MGIYINENFIITKKDYKQNLENWTIDKNNILFITGLSGSGKSTTSKSFAKKYDAIHIELDLFEHIKFIINSNNLSEGEKIIVEYFHNNKNLYSKIQNIDDHNFNYEFNKFFNYLLTKCKNEKKLFIFEGVQIFLHFDVCLFEDEPLIIKGTSMYKSIIQRFKRNGNGRIELFKELQNEFRELIKYYIDSEKKINSFNKKITNKKKSIKESQKFKGEMSKPIQYYSKDEFFTDCILCESAKESKTKYKCPFCNERDTRVNLVYHVQEEHEEMIPQDSTAARVVFNYINKKTHGKCVNCGAETKWNEKVWKYERYCSDRCLKEYSKMAKERMMKTYGKEHLLDDPEYQQNKMLSNRKISGTYTFADGGKRTYCGSYEKKLLEFYDQVLEVPSKDIQSPGPTIQYEFNGEIHSWITDQYYVPANLVHDVKDGGDNPNTREMPEYRAKQVAKETAIAKQKQYNYIRLTNNNFQQLILILMEIKEQLSDNNSEFVIDINENAAVGSAVVGIENYDNSYIIQCDINNKVVDTCYSTDRYLKTIYKIEDGKIKKINKKELRENYSYYSIFLYRGDDASIKNDKIIKDYQEQVDVDNDYFYKSLALKEMIDSKQIYFDENFIEVEDQINILQAKKHIIENSLRHQFKSKLNENYYFDLLKQEEKETKEKLLKEYSNINIQQDIDGYFVLNETAGLRTQSYKSLNDIQPFVLDLIEDGNIYE